MLINTMESKKWVNDPVLEKFVRIPSIYYLERMKKYGFDPAGKNILDFGCGSGLISTGLAAYFNPECVVGVDIELYINEDENREVSERFGFDYSDLSKHLEFTSVVPAQSLGEECYDCAVSWSVIEHVDRRIFAEQIHVIYKSLKNGGLAVIQSAPLYYSPFGSHVYDLPPWSHLYMSESEFESSLFGIGASNNRVEQLLSCKNTLNRFDSESFESVFLKSGFSIIEKYYTDTQIMPNTDLTKKFNIKTLLQEQGLWVLKK